MLLSLPSNKRYMFLIGSAVYSWAAFIRTCSFSSTCIAYLWAALHRAKTAYGHLLYKERRFSLITELSALLFSKQFWTYSPKLWWGPTRRMSWWFKKKDSISFKEKQMIQRPLKHKWNSIKRHSFLGGVRLSTRGDERTFGARKNCRS